MAKKSAVQPTFEVRFIGPGISPEKIPLRAVSDALAAIQDIASGRDPFEQQQVPQDRGIGLIDVKRGSAVYSCFSRIPDEALYNLTRVGSLLASDDASETFDAPEDSGDDALVTALTPIRSLSDIAKSVGCEVRVTTVGKTRESLCVFEANDYQRISQRLFVEGETTIVGRIERVGGATEMKCLLRIPGRRKLLYCDVANRDLVRRLGHQLYEQIAANGKVVWLNRSWRIHKFEISDFSQPKFGKVSDAIEDLRKAGLKAWDKIDDPVAYIRETR